MKKTILALFALAGVTVGDTTTWTMDDLAALATNTTEKATISTEWTYANGNVYSFSEGSYLGGISDSDLLSAVNLSDGTCITIAAWVRAESLSGYQAILGYGAQNDGFVFTLNGSNLLYTSKGVSERGFAPSGLTAGEWGLVAMTFVAGSKSTTTTNAETGQTETTYTTQNGRIHDAVGGHYTRQLGSFAVPDTDSQLFSIGSGNGTSARDSFTGDIAGLTIYTGTTTAVDYNTIKNLLGAAPTMVPEPTTATLSLLALAGLAMRRRRK